jgi:CBS domain-containing protein
MNARDVMVSPVVTVKLYASVKEVAQLLLERQISAFPGVVGIVSEGDLLHRFEAGTERRRSWWLLGLTREETLAQEYVKAHARKVADVMTSKVVTATPDTPLHEVATLMETNSVKRVPSQPEEPWYDGRRQLSSSGTSRVAHGIRERLVPPHMM